MTAKDHKDIALVLAGGGAKGSFQVGALKVLYEHGYQFDVISGVSVGALNGAMIATKQFEPLQQLWETIEQDDILNHRSLGSVIKQFVLHKIGIAQPPLGLNNNKPLKRLLSNHLLGQQIKIPYHFGFVKLKTGDFVNAIIRQKGHNINKDDILRILGSTAIPVKFDPVDFHGQLLVDGGIRNITPISEVLPYNPDRIVIIPTEPYGENRKAKDNQADVSDILQIAKQTVSIMLDEIFNQDIKRFLKTNHLVQQAKEHGINLEKPNGLNYQHIDPLIIAPKKKLGDALNFKRSKIDEHFEKGQQRARDILSSRE